MLRGVCLVKTFGSRSRASLFWVTSRDHRFESAKFHLHGRERPRRAAYSGPRYIGPAGRFLLRCSGARTNVPAYLGGGSMPTRPGALILAACLVLPLASAACSLIPSGGHADLAPTLSFQDEPGGPVAFQSGQPVPTFDRQPRLRAELDGVWRFDPQALDTGLSLTNRNSAMKAHQAELGDRAGAFYDSSGWPVIQVPGTFNPPPDRSTTGGFYRVDFFVPPEWSHTYSLLKFGAVRYIADVWLNGHY